jgi:hypothetical protein
MAATPLSAYLSPAATLLGGGLAAAGAFYQPENPLLPGQKEQLGLSNRLLGMDIQDKARLERQRRGFSSTLNKMFAGVKLASPAPASLSSQLAP